MKIAEIHRLKMFPDNEVLAEMQINRIRPDGTIEPYCWFLNNSNAERNMEALLMDLRHLGSYADEKKVALARKQEGFKIHEGKLGHLLWVECGGDIYITAPVTDEKGRVVWAESEWVGNRLTTTH